MPGGMTFHRCEGRLVSGAVPPPAARPLRRAARVPRPRPWLSGAVGVDVGTLTGPTACALASRPCALWVWRESVPGGAAFRRCEGRLSSDALPPPAARPLGGLSGSATHVLWARVCGSGGPALSLWLACPVGGCVPRGWWEAVPGGVAFHRCEGRLVSGAVPPPAARPFGRAAGVPRPVVHGRCWCRRGDPATAPQRALLRAVVERCWGGERPFQGGVAFHHSEGRLVSGALPPPAARSLGGLLGSAAHVLWARVCGHGCAAHPWGGRPGVGACCVCGACAVFVCWWVRGGALCAVVPWCVMLPPFVCLPGTPLSCAISRCCACRGLWPCPLLHVRPSLGCWLPSFILFCCGALYPLLYSPLARSPPWRAFFPASALVFVSVFSFAYFLVLKVLLLLSFSVL